MLDQAFSDSGLSYPEYPDASLLNHAVSYLKRGYPVIPVGQDKKPLISWKEFQNRLPTEEEVCTWWIDYPEANIGIVTGELSRLVVVDIDPRHGGDVNGIHLPPTVISRTGGGGWHYFYQYPKDRFVGNATSIRPGIDIRGEGGYVVVPPSVHESGQIYEWVEPLDLDSTADCPVWVHDEHESMKTHTPIKSVLHGVPVGNRNTSAARVAGLILSILKIGHLDQISWEFLKQWNDQNSPPIPEEELLAVFNSIRKRERGNVSELEVLSDLPTITVEELLYKEIPPPLWFLNCVIPSAGLVAVSGKPESFKTWFVMWMAWRMASGLPLFDPTEGKDVVYLQEHGKKHAGKASVLFIEEENTEGVMQDRLKHYPFPRPPEGAYSLLINKGFKFSSEPMREALKRRIKELGVKVLIIDPFSSVMGFQDENDNAEVAQMMDILRHEFIEALGLVIIFIHHPAKGAEGLNNLRGAGDILGKCDVHLNLEVEDAIAKIINVTYQKLRIEDRRSVHDFRMRMDIAPVFNHINFVYEGVAKSKSEEQRNVLTQKLLAAMEPGEAYAKTQLADLIGKRRTDSQFTNIFDQLVETKAILKSATPEGRYPKFYRPAGAQ